MTYDQPTASLSERESIPDPKRWLAAGVMLVAIFMDLLDTTIVNVAIPSIQQNLNAGYAEIQWITAGYAMAFAILLITGGRLGDIIGRKRTFEIGIAGFTLASTACGLAPSAEFLAGSRILQGAAAALMVPQVMSIIHVTFPARERGKAFGIFGAVAGLAAVAGPILGGVLVSADIFGLGWRAIFLINVPVGLLALAAGRAFISESRSENADRLDLRGMAVCSLALLLVVFPLVQGHELGWPWWIFALIAAAAPVTWFLTRHVRRLDRQGGSPLIVPSLFRYRSFVVGLGVQLAFHTVVALFFLSWTVYLQTGAGFSALRAGLTTVAFAIGAFASSGVAVAVLVQKYGRKVLIAGAAVELGGMLTLQWTVDRYGGDITLWAAAVPLLLVGFGFGLIAAPLPVIILTDVPTGGSGSASGLSNTVVQVGGAIGVALLGVTFFGPLGGGSPTSLDLTEAFGITLWAISGLLAVVLFLTCALPRRMSSE